MTPRLCLWLSSGLALWLLLALPGGITAPAAAGPERDKTTLVSTPALEGNIKDGVVKQGPPAPGVNLDPFFLIMEEGTRVRVRRVQVSLEFQQPEIPAKFNPQSPALRELVYDFLLTKDQAPPGRGKNDQEKVLARLVNRYLGQEAVSAVKVDQSFLLLR